MPWYLGRPGSIVQLPAPSRGTQTPYERLGATHQLLSGGRVRDSFGVKRSWQFTWQALTRDQVGILNGFVYGTVGPGPYVLVDPEQRNLLAPNVAAAGSVTNDTTGFTAPANNSIGVLAGQLTAAPKRIVMTLATSVTAFETILSPTAFTPVAAGLPYTFSAWIAVPATTTFYSTIAWFDSSFAAISSVDQGSYTNTSTWLTNTATAPANAAYAQWAIKTAVANTSGSAIVTSIEEFQFEQASARTTWVSGLGVPYVTVDGGGRGRQQTNQNDYSLTLVEL